MKRFFTLSIAMAMIAMTSYGQKIITNEGSPSVIKGQKDVAFLFTYDDLMIGKMTEANYIAKIKGERDAKAAGSGDKWERAFLEDRTKRYERKFEDLFNKYAGELYGTYASIYNKTGKYTIKVHTTMIEPGYNVGVSRMPALVNMEITIYETASSDKILYKATLLKAPGTSIVNDYDVGERISEAFAKAGKSLSIFLNKAK